MQELFGQVTPMLVLIMLPGLIQFVKDLVAVEGTWVKVLSFFVALVLGVLLQLQVMYPAISQWFTLAIYSILFSMAANGYYDIAKTFAVKG